jgi:hypothetical protein
MRSTFRSSRATERSDSPGDDQPGERTHGSLGAYRRWRELAYRCSDGLDVTLFWCPATDELMVRGYDRRSGVRFELRPERHLALDAFYHPYMYVAGNDVHYDDH